MLVLKHLFDWSFDECEREVRGSLVYRPFCRIDGERVPDAKTLIRLSHCLGPDVLKGLVERLVALARQRRVVRGGRLEVVAANQVVRELGRDEIVGALAILSGAPRSAGVRAAYIDGTNPRLDPRLS